MSDKELLKAIKQQVLDNIKSRAQAQNVINNYVGGEPSNRPKGESPTLNERMLSAKDEGDEFNYNVMIGRKDRPDGEGWDKKVHRYRLKPGEADPYDDIFEHLKKKAGILKEAKQPKKKQSLT